MKGWKKIFQTNRNEKTVWIALKKKYITKDKEGNDISIMIKILLQKEDVTFVKINSPNITVPRYIKEILTDTKGETDNHTILIGHFNPPIISVDRSFRKKINKETVALGDTFELDLIGICRTLHHKTEEYIFLFSLEFSCFIMLC